MKWIPRLLPLGLSLGLIPLFWPSASPEADGARSSSAHAVPLIKETTAFTDFRSWLASDSPVTEETLNLVKKRQTEMLFLMEHDPKTAIAESLTWEEFLLLPASLKKHVEEPFSIADGEFENMIECGPVPSHTLSLDFADKATRSASYGVRGGSTFSRRQTAVQGIRLGDRSVIREKSLQRLTPSEADLLSQHFPAGNPNPRYDIMSGEEIHPETEIAALFGARLFTFASHTTLAAFEKKIEVIESHPGPDNGSAVFFEGLEKWAAAYEDANTFNWSSVEGIAESIARQWTGAERSAYIIRVSFPDLSVNTTTATEVRDVLIGPVNAALQDMSYGKVRFTAVVNGTVDFTTQYPSTYYRGLTDQAGNPIANGTPAIGEIGSEIISLLEAANPGFDFSEEYDVVITHFPKLPGVKSAAAIGGGRMRLNGTTSTDTIVHEILHHLGMSHSSSWVSPSANPADPAGSIDEYGHPFDVMADARAPYSHLRAQGKAAFGWLDSAQWAEITSDGTYRIYPFDLPATDSANALRALKIPRNGSNQSYWVSFRRGIPGPESFRRGANITWQKSAGAAPRAFLLDLKNGGSNFQDPGLALGQTFSSGGVHITTMAVGGETPNEYLDIKVVLGNDLANVAPVGTLTSPINANAREAAIFKMEATDADDDELVYHWDTGNGLITSRDSVLRHAFAIGGTYTVKCTVSDTRGRTFSAQQDITVADPLTTWTQRNSQTTENLFDVAANDTLVVACGANGTIVTSPNGVTWTDRSLPDPHILSGICWSDFHQKFFIAGRGSGIGKIYSSPDGAAWTKVLDSGPGLFDIACKPDGRVLAVGNFGRAQRSTSGISWFSQIVSGQPFLTSIAYGDDVFIALAQDSDNEYPKVFHSETGQTWTDESVALYGLQPNDNLTHVRYLRDRFLVTGTNGTQIRFSTDAGQTFSSRITEDRRGNAAAPSAPRWHCPAMAASGLFFFAGGIDNQGAPSDINLISLDGAHFQAFPAPNQADRNAAVIYQKRVITVAMNGEVWISGQFLTIAPSFSLWQQRRRANLSELGRPEDDPDGDGRANLLEYALRTDPTESDPPLLFDNSAVEIGGESYLQSNALDVSTLLAPDVEFLFQGSPDLSGWTDLDSSNSIPLSPLGIQLTTPIDDSGSYFTRLRLKLMDLE